MRSREEGQEGTWALLSPSPMWGAPGKEYRLGEPSKEQRTRSPALVGPGTARQERQNYLLDGLGTLSATISLQTLPRCHLLSLCPPHCHPPHSTACAQPCVPLPGAVHPLCHLPPQSRLHSPHCHLLGDRGVPCPVPPSPRGHSGCTPASPTQPVRVSLPLLVTETPLPSVSPSWGAGSEHPGVTSHTRGAGWVHPAVTSPAAQPVHTHAGSAVHPACTTGLLFPG